MGEQDAVEDRAEAGWIVAGDFADVLRRLFQLDPERHLRFGPARSQCPAASLDALSRWCVFDDYVMEGTVRYGLRARSHPGGLLLEVQLTGMQRDRFVVPFVRDYIKWAGFAAPIAVTSDKVTQDRRGGD
jgi:hypothetical protein